MFLTLGHLTRMGEISCPMPPGSGEPWWTPEKPTPCQSTKTSHTRDCYPEQEPEKGAPAAPHLQAQRALVPEHGGSPRCPGQSRARPGGVAGLTDAVCGGQEQEQQQRDHGAGAAVPRARVRELLRVPWEPPVVTIRPHSCSGRSPVANRLGSFPQELLLCLSARRRGVLRTAAFVARVGDSVTRQEGTSGGDAPHRPHPWQQMSLPSATRPEPQAAFEVPHLHSPTLHGQRPGGDSCRWKIRFYLSGQLKSSGSCPSLWQGGWNKVVPSWSRPAQTVPWFSGTEQGVGEPRGPAPGGCTPSRGPGGCGGSGRICG